MIAFIDPAARPALTAAGVFWVNVFLLGCLYVWRNRRRLFGPDSRIDGDRPATRYLQIIAICAPLLLLTGRVVSMVVGLWIK